MRTFSDIRRNLLAPFSAKDNFQMCTVVLNKFRNKYLDFRIIKVL